MQLGKSSIILSTTRMIVAALPDMNAIMAGERRVCRLRPKIGGLSESCLAFANALGKPLFENLCYLCNTRSHRFMASP